MKVGYRRVSTLEQSLDRQDLGKCDRLFEEKESAASAKRPALQAMLSFVRSGDVVVVHSTDRLARNLMDLQSIIQDLNDKGVNIRLLSENLSFSADGGCAFQTLQLQMLGAFAQFERTMIRKRQAEGIAKAKAKGVYAQRKRIVNPERVKQLFEDGMSKAAIAKHLNISRMSVYRCLAA
ncbi:recombinase family protein [Rhodobacteraceae bacterium]|nr:recombinase family protein [Paracoccaceae bacterium]